MIFCLIFFIGRCSYDAHDLFQCHSATFRVRVSKKTEKSIKPRKPKNNQSKKPNHEKKPIRIFRKFLVRFGFGFSFIMLKLINSNRTEPVQIKKKRFYK
jgi:hypothetical protein